MTKSTTTINQVFTHPGQPQMQVEVILASKSTVAEAPPIYTIRMRYPRIIHGEIMTHRVFSRNARSSRAVPVKTMLNEVRTIPFLPWHWGANQKGMQADKECNAIVNMSWCNKEYDCCTARAAWQLASEYAVNSAEAFMEAGYHKQIPNRLLEPFSWMDTLITSTDWANFLWLRDHKDAEPHLQDLARLVAQAISCAGVQELQPDEWHLPYITNNDRHTLLIESGRLAGERYEKITGTDDFQKWLLIVSAARCARISYKPFDGDASYEREFERYNSLVTSDRVHASPLEHQAMPDTRSHVQKQFFADEQSPESYDQDCNWEWDKAHLHGNLTGWIQYRKTVPNEHYKG